MNKVHILGIGPGGEDYLLPISKRIALEADTLIGGKRALALFEGSGKKEIPITAMLEEVRDYIEDNYRKEKIAVLVSGDPGLYSLLRYLRRYFADQILEVIPGISAIQVAFARGKRPWDDAQIISLHGKDQKERLLKLVKEGKKVGFFTDNNLTPNVIAQYLMAEGYGDRDGTVCESLSYPEERVIEGSLEELSKDNFGPLTVMVIWNE